MKAQKKVKEISPWKVKSVKDKVKKAISQYCKDEGITQAKYLEKDKRLKAYLV